MPVIEGADVPVAEQTPVIAVASGKGGVGKTTVAVNLALALTAAGRRVGLVDADLYGPDVPRMLGLRRTENATTVTVFAPRGSARSRLEAVQQHGIQLVSAAFLLGERQGLGVEAGIAKLLVARLITGTTWDDPDCLVLDLPPGMADIQQLVFGLSRRVLVLLVVTPQVVAHADARRLLADLARHQAASIGGVENMSGQICPSCGQATALFPEAPPRDSIWGQVTRLVRIPFSAVAASDADRGRPVMLTRAVPEQVSAYELLATEVDKLLSPA
jgi:ATP-binding protein involved in chromosome partitioning